MGEGGWEEDVENEREKFVNKFLINFTGYLSSYHRFETNMSDSIIYDELLYFKKVLKIILTWIC